MSRKAQREINRVFKRHALSVRGEASKILKEYVDGIPDAKTVSQLLEDIVVAIKEHGLESSMVTHEILRPVLDAMSQEDDVEIANVEPLTVIDAFNTPRFVYNHIRKAFAEAPPKKTDALLKGLMFRERHEAQLKARLLYPHYHPAWQRCSIPVVGVGALSQTPRA